MFWHIKNWSYVNEHTNQKRFPVMLAVFASITYFMLLGEIQKAGAPMGKELKVCIPLWVLVYFVLCPSYNFLAYVGFIAPALAVFALIPAQKFINTLNAESKTPINSRFSIASLLPGTINNLLFAIPVQLLLAIIGLLSIRLMYQKYAMFF